MQCDVVTVGDALVDIYLFLNPANEHCYVNQSKSEMCFVMGAKVPVEDCQFMLGGNACNVGVGLSRLGIKTALGAEIGDDEFSQKIIAGLHQDNVDTTFLKQTSNAQASFSIDLSFVQDRTIFSRHVKRSHDIPIDNAECSYIYLTSLGEEWKSLYGKVRNIIEQKKIKLAFNPGSKQLQAGVETFKEMFAVTEVLFINKEEAEDILYGKDQNISEDLKKPEKLLQEVQKLGPKIISITDGGNGAYAIDAGGSIHFQGVVPSQLVQKTGVGDAYATGFLAGILQGKAIQEAMLWGATNSASVMEQIGAQTGLLTKEQLIERIEKISNS